MPVVHELFGERVTESGSLLGKFRNAQCPYMNGKQCDGGGNRDMARWPAKEQPLAPFFEKHVGVQGGGYIPCGVCSVAMAKQSWAICPRRLLTLEGESQAQKELRERILSVAGFVSGDRIQVWSEIALRDSDTNMNYRLDYVLMNDDRPPVIIEVMTASTSGGNKSERTDIQSAFCDGVLYSQGLLEERRQSPGVNVRQVWARMASQMIVKSQVANAWGGRTIWVIQDALLSYIRSNTGLRVDDLHSPDWQAGEVNVISSDIDYRGDIRLYSGPVQSRKGEACWSELLNTPAIPKVDILTEKLNKGNRIAEFTVE